MNDQPNDEIYDDEAFIGVEEGLITDGKVLDDLDAEGTLPRHFRVLSDPRQPAKLPQCACVQ